MPPADGGAWSFEGNVLVEENPCPRLAKLAGYGFSICTQMLQGVCKKRWKSSLPGHKVHAYGDQQSARNMKALPQIALAV